MGPHPFDPSIDWWNGFTFTAANSGVVESIDVAVSTYSGSSPAAMTFGLYTDVNGAVGSLLEEITVNALQLFGTGSVETGIAAGTTSMSAGTAYWLMAYSAASTVWNSNNTGDVLNQAYSTTGFGGTLAYYDNISEPDPFPSVGFRINAVPEPTTLVLMGLGLAGIGWKRRKAA